jgi:hypothetical protein
MASRLELQTKLEELLGSRSVYYQPPTNTKMGYPAIRYSKKSIESKYADNKIYSRMTCYELIVISTTPDHPVIEQLLELPYCSYDRHYAADNLNHDVFTLYF